MLLERFKGYSRIEIWNILDPSGKPGKWNMSGIVRIEGTKNYVFLVSDDTKSSYQDELYTDGNLLWYSQNRMDLNNKQVVDFINHNSNVNNLYLFWRPRKEKKYYYLGLLEYGTHDNQTHNPVRFYFHIIDFDEHEALNLVNGLQLKNRKNGSLVSGVAGSAKFGGTSGSAVSNNGIGRLNGKLIVTPVPVKRRSGKQAIKKSRSGVTSAAFIGGNVDFENEAKKNSRLGNAGEDMVVKFEKERLTKAGHPELAQKVEVTRNTIGNAAVYDIRSFKIVGLNKIIEIYIEVKTTTGGINNSYHISEREVAFSESVPNQYFLYRVYDFDIETGDGKLYIQEGSIDRKCLKATSYVSM